ncbi:MAG TPA: GDSL lipase [Mycobacterium sp.]|nr:GDSL lipase [Mycobacterium sp.]
MTGGSRRLAATVGVSLVALVTVAATPWVRSVAGRPVPYRHYEATMLGSAQYHVAVIGDSYTAGSAEGGEGPNGWTERAWQTLGQRGVPVTADVASEGGAGYVVRGNRGDLFEDLTAQSVQPDDALVVFFGSRNDQDVDPAEMTRMAHDTLGLARRVTPSAKMLVIGPPWPTADVPGTVLRIRDILGAEAHLVGAEFVDPIADRWFVDRPDLIGADGVHPNDAGHAYLADKIVPLISALLPKQA